MTPIPTAAARVSGTIKALEIAKIIKDGLSGPMFDEPDIQEAHERDILETATRILAAIQPDPEPKPVACPECGDTGMRDTGGVYPWGEHISAACDCTPTSAGMVSVEEAAKVAECAFDDRPRSRVGHPSHMDWEDGFRDGTHAAATALRALAGEGGR